MGWRPLVSVWLFISTVCTVLCHPAESVCPSDTILWCHQPLPTLSSSRVRPATIPNTTLFAGLQVVFGMGEPGSRGGIFSWHHKHKKISATKRFLLSIFYHITVWGIGKLAPLLAEKVPCTEAVWEVERGGAEGGAVAASSPLPNEADKGWDPLSGLKSVTPWLSSK